MIDTRAVGQELQDLQHQIVGRIRQGQQTVAGTIKTLANTAQATRPQIPGLPMTALTDKLPKPADLAARLPKPEDLTARLPKPEALIAGGYDLAEQLLAAQRRLTGQVIHAAMPLARQGAAMFGQSVSQPARSAARTSRPATPATSAKPTTPATSATSATSAVKAGQPAAAKATKPAASAAKSARTARTTRTAQATKASSAGTSTKATPATSAGENRAATAKARPAKK